MSHELSDFEAGAVLCGRYRVERVLGHGGMGVVVAAEDLGLCRKVAVKCIRGATPPSPAETERVVREARVLAQLKSEHVVHVTDVGTLDSGASFIVMEYLEGEDLGRYLRARGPLPAGEAVGYVMQVLAGLAEAHRVGVVHRDLKPSNLLLTTGTDGSTVVKIIDFGISKILSAEAIDAIAAATTGAAFGSPHYASPEQMRDPRSVDARTDIWSLGVVLYELLTGQYPHAAPSVSGLAVAIVTEPARPPRDYRPDLPGELERVVLRCLEKKPAKRYATVAQLAEALTPFSDAPDAVFRLESIKATLARGPGADKREVDGRESTQLADTAGLATFSRTWRLSSSGRRWAAVAAVAAVVAIVAAWLGIRGRSGAVRAHVPETVPAVSARPMSFAARTRARPTQPRIEPERSAVDGGARPEAASSEASARWVTPPRAVPSSHTTRTRPATPPPAAPSTALSNSAIDSRF